MIRLLGTTVGDLIWVALADRPYVCRNEACPWRTLTRRPRVRRRLTNGAAQRALEYGLACGWCGHTMQRRAVAITW